MKTYVKHYEFKIQTDCVEINHAVEVIEVDEKIPDSVSQYKAYCAAVEYALAHCYKWVYNIHLTHYYKKLI